MRQSIIVAFGYHDLEAPRYRNIRRALEAKGYAILECHTSATGFLAKCVELFSQWNKVKGTADAMYVTFPGQYLVPLTWILTRYPRKKLIFDAFVSLHDSMVDDRKLVSSWSPRAWFLYAIDWLSCHLADEVILDTKAHRSFFIARFHLKPDRVRVIYLGSRTDLFKPEEKGRRRAPGDLFKVFFYGTYIPLQGIEHIIDAAKILQERHANVRITLVGSGQMRDAMEMKAAAYGLTNVTFQSFVPLEALPAMIRASDLCLGIFGATAKAQRVIPHKVFDAVACGVPVLTEDSPAIRELFARDPLVLLCPAGNPEAIADAILKMGNRE